MLHIITGPPAAGKTTYVATHAKPGDIRIDLDHIANLITGKPTDNHEHNTTAFTIAKAARNAAIQSALRHSHHLDVWVIDTNPSAKRRQQYDQHNAQYHHLDPGRETVMHRCKHQRPTSSLIAAANWYDKQTKNQHTPPRKKQTTSSKGLGWRHQKQRQQLLHHHKDGTPCWWCGKPMFKTPEKNHDGLALAADHTQARAHGGTRADRLLHSTCNSARGDGTRDHQRPTLTKTAGEGMVPNHTPGGIKFTFKN